MGNTTFTVQQQSAMDRLIQAEALLKAAQNNLTIYKAKLAAEEAKDQKLPTVKSQIVFFKTEIDKLVGTPEKQGHIPRLTAMINGYKTDIGKISELDFADLRDQVIKLQKQEKKAQDGRTSPGNESPSNSPPASSTKSIQLDSPSSPPASSAKSIQLDSPSSPKTLWGLFKRSSSAGGESQHLFSTSAGELRSNENDENNVDSQKRLSGPSSFIPTVLKIF